MRPVEQVAREVVRRAVEWQFRAFRALPSGTPLASAVDRLVLAESRAVPVSTGGRP